MRVIPNGSGSSVTFTVLRRPGVPSNSSMKTLGP
jgi:hypothetical protein